MYNVHMFGSELRRGEHSTVSDANQKKFRFSKARVHRRVMVASFAQGAPNGLAKPSYHTVTSLSRWSCLATSLPAVDKIKAIHIYDFDNTLFKTPLPNPSLWNGPTIGLLSSPDFLTNGGWWHDSRILAATGDGVEKEEARAYQGWWNEKIAKLVRLSMKQKDALCVLLTGRSEHGYADLVKRICKSKKLEFDMMGLKPRVGPQDERFSNTMQFKQAFLEAILETYKFATEIRIYEDRHKHVKQFRDFMNDYNARLSGGTGLAPTRSPIAAEVIHVFEKTIHLKPVVEVAKVQQMVNEHNQAIAKDGDHPMSNSAQISREKLAIKKTVFFTSYMIKHADSQKLIKLAQIPAGVAEQDLKYHANNILICPRPCPASILEKVGGMGSKMKWMVTGTACLDNSIWAACLRPVPDTAKFHTDNPFPLVVLALRKGAKPIDAGKIKSWQPVPADKAYVFETTVREKVILRIEPEDPREDEYESLFANKASKRKHNADDEYPRGPKESYHGPNSQRGSFRGRGGYRGGSANSRGYRGGARGAARGRGRGGFSYRSLDDVDTRNQTFGVDYDDSQANQGFGGQGRQPPTQPAAHGRPGGTADLGSYY
ncbi:hypothetical protein jhhlp_000347 [Lomentospora prolificans]|uniref:Swiss Army Knife RNA repair protein HAD domain-containing protein n=1 Tax=Lomentospora prolificans TaxID=41688 RepID=A0A2N3NKK6_9PEZI|nr:hypothetical protein jhhlp_000347 [Lomentospora prolificans]